MCHREKVMFFDVLTAMRTQFSQNQRAYLHTETLNNLVFSVPAC